MPQHVVIEARVEESDWPLADCLRFLVDEGTPFLALLTIPSLGKIDPFWARFHQATRLPEKGFSVRGELVDKGQNFIGEFLVPHRQWQWVQF